jgi:hypothetical protein
MSGGRFLRKLCTSMDLWVQASEKSTRDTVARAFRYDAFCREASMKNLLCIARPRANVFYALSVAGVKSNLDLEHISKGADAEHLCNGVGESTTDSTGYELVFEGGVAECLSDYQGDSTCDTAGDDEILPLLICNVLQDLNPPVHDLKLSLSSQQQVGHQSIPAAADTKVATDSNVEFSCDTMLPRNVSPDTLEGAMLELVKGSSMSFVRS